MVNIVSPSQMFKQMKAIPGSEIWYGKSHILVRNRILFREVTQKYPHQTFRNMHGLHSRRYMRQLHIQLLDQTKYEIIYLKINNLFMQSVVIIHSSMKD